MTRPLSVLFLCTGNSCRSIMAEALLSHFGDERLISYSAGSYPTGEVNPLSLTTLRNRGISTTGYRSKSWNDFDNHHIDVVITVCDAAAGESCPIFPGKPLKAHWGVPDPASFQGNDQEIYNEFSRICDILERRIKALIDLPTDRIDNDELQQKLLLISEII